MNENVIPVKTGIQKGFIFKIILRIAQFGFKIFFQGSPLDNLTILIKSDNENIHKY